MGERAARLQYFQCPTCDFDSEEAGRLSSWSSGICPLCAGDSGSDEWMTYRDATDEEIARFATGRTP